MSPICSLFFLFLSIHSLVPYCFLFLFYNLPLRPVHCLSELWQPAIFACSGIFKGWEVQYYSDQISCSCTKVNTLWHDKNSSKSWKLILFLYTRSINAGMIKNLQTVETSSHLLSFFNKMSWKWSVFDVCGLCARDALKSLWKTCCVNAASMLRQCCVNAASMRQCRLTHYFMHWRKVASMYKMVRQSALTHWRSIDAALTHHWRTIDATQQTWNGMPWNVANEMCLLGRLTRA